MQESVRCSAELSCCLYLPATTPLLLLCFCVSSAGEAAGSVLASVGGAAKALLGGLLGPLEKEGAFDEATAAITGACAAWYS